MTDLTTVEEALVALELKLDEAFEVAKYRADRDDQGSGLIVEQALDLIYDTFDAVIPYDRIGVAVVEDDGELMHARWARSEADNLTMGTGHAAPLSEDVVRSLFESGEPLLINDLAAHGREHPDPTRAAGDPGPDAGSCIACPLGNAHAPVGWIVFSSERKGAYEADHKAVLVRIADHIVTILERSRMYERLVDLNWQLRVARDALQQQATHDALTGLLNRSAIIEKAQRELDRARRQRKPVAIVMCDVDRFKAVNDEHGQVVGDAVLRAIAACLESALRSYEKLGRYGGEEFFIALYDCSADDAPQALERLRAAVAHEPLSTEHGDYPVTISLGCAVSPDASADIDDLIRAAEEAVSEAKNAGRDGYRVRVVDGGD